MVNYRKPKVGIITFHRAINYGAILQVFALTKSIKDIGAECVVIDYRNDKLENHHKRMKISDSRSVKDILKFFLVSKYYNKKHNSFREFSKKHLNLSRAYYNAKDIRADEHDYDMFITGSDQVWNFTISNNDAVYLLDFITDTSKKNSYAASFGHSNLDDSLHDIFYKSLKNYNEISVREKQGQEIIKNLINEEVEVVIDPTLLIEKEYWYSMAEEFKNNKRYILIYAFGGSQSIFELANKISQKTGYEIVCITNEVKMSNKIKYIRSASPEEYLGLFMNAEYIITNSFHGTAFSINFNKQFYTELLSKRNATNSRMVDILNMFDLQDRIISDVESIDLNQTIDYKNVNETLRCERKKAREFLNKIVTKS